MVAVKIRYEEGSYEGEVNEAKIPEGKGTFEYRFVLLTRKIFHTLVNLLVFKD